MHFMRGDKRYSGYLKERGEERPRAYCFYYELGMLV